MVWPLTTKDVPAGWGLGTTRASCTMTLATIAVCWGLIAGMMMGAEGGGLRSGLST